MELKTKYQYTYFIYPYLIEEKKYTSYLYELSKNPKCKFRWFNHKKDIGIDSYFLPELKEKMFWTLDIHSNGIKQFETMDTRMKASMLGKQACNIFEYELEKDIPGKNYWERWNLF